MFNKSIAYRLSIFISIAVIAVFISFIAANYLFNRMLMRENLENKAIGMSMEVNSLINKYIITTKEITNNLTDLIIYYSKNQDAELLLTNVMNEYPFLNAIHVMIDSAIPLPFNNYYIFQKNGNLTFEQGKDTNFFCPNEQKMFVRIRELNTSGWTEPYRCIEKGNLVVSYFNPIWNYNEDGTKIIAGHVISEISLLELNVAINQMKIGDRGYAFLVNKNGDYITHPDESRILNKNVYELHEKILDRKKINISEIFSAGKTGSAIIFPEILNFEKSWVYYTPINENRWFLIFIMPYREIFADLYRFTIRMIIFAFLGILFISIIVNYIAKKQIEPLSDLTSKLSEFSAPKADGIEISKNEVKKVADSLEYLKARFEQYRIAREEEELKSLRRKQDLMQASEIQQSLIKTTFPAFPERKDIDLYAIYKPAREISGDLFDYFFVDDENLVFTIGDVSGKGIPAAIFMSVAQTIIKNHASYKKAKNIVNKANIELCTSNQHQYFLTLFLGVLNIKKGELNFCNAAHNFPYILKPDGKIVELKLSHGLPLGLYPDKGYKDAKVKLEPGDTIVLYTDGVTEMVNDRKIQFGSDRFKENLRKFEGLPPSEIVQRLNKKLESFKGEAAQADDICLFVIKYTP